MKVCRNGLHDMTEANTARHSGSNGKVKERCRACVNAKVARQRAQVPSGPRRPQRPIADTATDFVFLFETGLSPRAIAAKLDMRYGSLLIAVRRAGVGIVYDRRLDTWRMP